MSTGTGLVPQLTGGTLIAQGQPVSFVGPVHPPAAPASQTSYLFYNLSTGFYWANTLAAVTSGDAFCGIAVAGVSTITSVTNATKLFGLVDVPATGAPGDFSVAHLLGRMPIAVDAPLMTSPGVIYFQPGTLYDSLNIYLTASDAGLTAKVRIY